jgi:hypothetical protein
MNEVGMPFGVGCGTRGLAHIQLRVELKVLRHAPTLLDSTWTEEDCCMTRRHLWIPRSQ